MPPPMTATQFHLSRRHEYHSRRVLHASTSRSLPNQQQREQSPLRRSGRNVARAASPSSSGDLLSTTCTVWVGGVRISWHCSSRTAQ